MDHTSRSQPRLDDHVQITDITVNFLGKYTPSTKLELSVERVKYETDTPTRDKNPQTLKWAFKPVPVWPGETARVQVYCHKAPIYFVNRKKCPEIKIPAEDLVKLFSGELSNTVHITRLQECEITLAVAKASFLAPQPVTDEDIPNIKNLPMSPEDALKQIANVSSVLDDFGQSSACINKIVEVVRGLSSIHPIAEVAVTALTAAYNALQKAKAFNDDLRDLAKEMHWLLALLAEQDCAKIEIVKDVFIDIMKKMQEISRFIEAYLQKQTAAQIAAAVLSGNELVMFKDDLITLGRVFRTTMPVQISGQVDQVATRVGMIGHNVATAEEERILARLKPVEEWPFVEPCLEGTRKDVLDTIDEWVDSSNGTNILWVNGSPGAGKSAIASTMVSRLLKRGILGSRFFFKSGHAKMGVPASFWRHVAFSLAKFDPYIRQKIVAVVADDKGILDGADTQLHFQELVEKVLSTHPSTARFVIVVDALDECTINARDSQRRTFLNTLRSWADLPCTFKLLVTSRDEYDIRGVLQDISFPVTLQVGSLVTPRTSDDIRVFFAAKFADITSHYSRTLSPDWPGGDVVDQLTGRAAGLFIWAETVTKWIQDFDPVGTLDEVMSGHEEGKELDMLYSKILSRFTSTVKKEAFKGVVGCIITARAPLGLNELKALLGQRDARADSILNELSSVISQDPSGRFQIRHLSFTDFVTDKERCGQDVYIDRSEHNLNLGRSCLRIMNEGLVFNILGIDSSYVMNDDIPDLSERIHRCIPSHLRYACSFWWQHLERTTSPINDAPTLQFIRDFTDDHFLHWLEVLSLTDQVRPAILGLRSVASSIQVAYDASKFITLVSTMDPASVPHIYMSALPCSSSLSRVPKRFSGKYPHTLVVETGRDSEWSAHVMALKGNEIGVKSVAFSHDGRVIASCSLNMTIRIWDMQTGQPISKPLRGHSVWVNCVAFSHDGKYIASGSVDRTVRIWDVWTGQQVLCHRDDGDDDSDDYDVINYVCSMSFSPDGKYLASSLDEGICIWHFHGGRVSQPFEGYVDRDWVLSLAFSPNGRYLVSGSDGGTICIWDVQLRREVFAPFKGHEDRVRSVAFSHDGHLIASGSDDRTIRIWNAQTGQQEYEPFKGHTSHVNSVAFLSDGRHIVSGSEDKTVRIWNVDTGQQVSSLQHGSGVNSVALSSDGRFIASGSNDNTVHIWDTRISHQALESLEKHDKAVQSVSFSPDGAHLGSGSSDGTIRVWDVETSQQVYGPLKGHTRQVNSVAFSPDGKSIVSGSDDKTVRVWSVHSDQEVFKLFEGHQRGVQSVSFSPDGRHVVSGSYDHAVFLWDVHAAGGQQVLKTFKGHTDSVLSVAFSPDGKHIASCSEDKTIRIWDVMSGQQVSELLQGDADWGVRSVAFSPDGKYIASGSGDKTVRIWDVQTHQLYKLLEGHGDYVAFSPNRRYIVSSSDDCTIRIWDAHTGQQVLEPLEGYLSSVTSVAFSPNGGYIASGSWDQTIRVWDVSDIVSTTPSSVDTRYNTTIDHECSFSWHVPNIRHEPGWVYCCSNPHHKKRLFWLPRDYFQGLFWPRTKAIMGARPVKLDLTNFVHGTSWTDCQEPLPS